MARDCKGVVCVRGHLSIDCREDVGRGRVPGVNVATVDLGSLISMLISNPRPKERALTIQPLQAAIPMELNGTKV